MEWQPIATAPRDCTPILTFWRHSGHAISWYDWDDEREGFRCADDDCIPKNQEACTHWMPLPAPPTV
jgi:hypothetical protein